MLPRNDNGSTEKSLVRDTVRSSGCDKETPVTSVAQHNRVVFSGIQPTGIPHLGIYLGAIKQWVELQKEPGDIYYTILDLSTLISPSYETINEKVLEVTACLLACGINPERCIILKQSDIKEVGLLYWVLNCLFPQNALENLPEWKKNSLKERNAANLGLYTDPVLLTAIYLLYKATHVPVGRDQIVYQEFFREGARRFNVRYKTKYFPESKCLLDLNGAEIRGLQNPHSKMGKSEPGDLGRIHLADSDDAIMRKLKSSVTDNMSAVTYDPSGRPGLSNLIQIHSAITGKSTTEICNHAQAEGMDTDQYKVIVAEEMIKYLRPIRMEYERLMKNKSYLNNVLRKCSEKAKETAEKNWKEIAEIIGLCRK